MLQQIENDLKEALKNQDKIKSGVLRLLISKCKNKSIATGKPLEDSEVMKVLQTAAKQHKESIKLYKQGNRSDLVDQETAELGVVEGYLPSMMTEDEIKAIVLSVIDNTGASSMADFGKVMPEVMKQGSGKIDGGVAQNILKELLS
ncbi:MAG: GatB/YqeY domain-containing protein [Candidatus Neomarinimicrobiota bacterium]|nr:GatB/YqeY domain-containing protein [Candidatus Neomarinimicrobiota bacterium]